MSYHRKQEDNRRLKHLYENGANKWCMGVGFYNGRFIKWYPYSSNYNRKKFYCNLTNRKVRRMKSNYNLSRGQYKKVFDLWWTLF